MSGDKKFIYIFMIVGIALLLISCINFINLYKAQNSNRKSEIGIIKIFGATKSKLIFRFLFETFIHILFAFIIAIGLIIIFLPLLNNILSFELKSQLSILKVPGLILLGTFILW